MWWIFRPRPRSGLVFVGARMTYYRAVLTREFPEWRATLTGGGIPKSGQVFTSLSYARLVGDVADWLEWNEWGELNGWVRDPDLYHQDDEDNSDRWPGGEGWSLEYDCRWPKEVKDALARYWAARKTIDEASPVTEEASVALGEPLCAIHDELQAGEADVAELVHLPVDKAEEIMLVYRSREGFLCSGRTLEQWRAWREEGGGEAR